MTATAADILRATKRLGADYRDAITMPLEAVYALDLQYGRVRTLDHALASKVEAFRLAAAFVVELVTVVKIMEEAERARQAGKRAKADALSARVTKLLTSARARAVS
jgi:hypothetical protein